MQDNHFPTEALQNSGQAVSSPRIVFIDISNYPVLSKVPPSYHNLQCVLNTAKASSLHSSLLHIFTISLLFRVEMDAFNSGTDTVL